MRDVRSASTATRVRTPPRTQAQSASHTSGGGSLLPPPPPPPNSSSGAASPAAAHAEQQQQQQQPAEQQAEAERRERVHPQSQRARRPRRRVVAAGAAAVSPVLVRSPSPRAYSDGAEDAGVIEDEESAPYVLKVSPSAALMPSAAAELRHDLGVSGVKLEIDTQQHKRQQPDQQDQQYMHAHHAPAAGGMHLGGVLDGALPLAAVPELSVFVRKLFEMLSDEAAASSVAWSASGDSFVISDVMRLQDVVLPRYFKHNNFASFARQLNLYGFRKLGPANVWQFHHPEFIRGHPELLGHIKRRPSAASGGGGSASAMEASPSGGTGAWSASSPAATPVGGFTRASSGTPAAASFTGVRSVGADGRQGHASAAPAAAAGARVRSRAANSSSSAAGALDSKFVASSEIQELRDQYSATWLRLHSYCTELNELQQEVFTLYAMLLNTTLGDSVTAADMVDDAVPQERDDKRAAASSMSATASRAAKRTAVASSGTPYGVPPAQLGGVPLGIGQGQGGAGAGVTGLADVDGVDWPQAARRAVGALMRDFGPTSSLASRLPGFEPQCVQLRSERVVDDRERARLAGSASELRESVVNALRAMGNEALAERVLSSTRVGVWLNATLAADVASSASKSRKRRAARAVPPQGDALGVLLFDGAATDS